MHLGLPLQVLNLRLNRCEDNGVSHLFQDLGTVDLWFLLDFLLVACGVLFRLLFGQATGEKVSENLLSVLVTSARPLLQCWVPCGPMTGHVCEQAPADPEHCMQCGDLKCRASWVFWGLVSCTFLCIPVLGSLSFYLITGVDHEQERWTCCNLILFGYGSEAHKLPCV